MEQQTHRHHKAKAGLLIGSLIGFFVAVLVAATIKFTADIVNGKNAARAAESAKEAVDWKARFAEKLPLLGHRNWVLVVDGAFPLQSAEGMTYLDTKLPLEQVLPEVLAAIDSSTHIQPILYTDCELAFVTDELCPGAGAYRAALASLLGARPVQNIPHNEVFAKLDEASKLFHVVVLKTTTAIPYSSVFIELDCGYWNAAKEQALREAMDCVARGK